MFSVEKFQSLFIFFEFEKACEDPCLDDAIEMAKRFEKLSVPHELIIAQNGVTHAFLNMKNLTSETQDALYECIRVIQHAFNQFNQTN